MLANRHHAVIHSGTIIGDGVRIDDFACIGKLPMRAKNSANPSTDKPEERCIIGSHVTVGTAAVIYKGAKIADDCLIADGATIREDVSVGKQTIVGRGACVENHCRVGARVKIETNAYITAYSTVEDDCFIAPGVITSNDNFAGRTKERLSQFKGVTVKRGGRLGAGTVVLPGKTIGEDGFAAAGSTVSRDVPNGTIVAGPPAKRLRDVPEEQLLKNQS